MKLQVILLATMLVAINSCTTIYRNVQTPDDVYFSKATLQEEYVQVDTRKNKYDYNDEYYDNRFLRMKVYNRNRWNDFNDWYGYERYSSRYNFYFGSYYNPYTSWNYYYNPYSPNTVILVYPKLSTTTNPVKPKAYNLNAYTNTNYNNSNTKVKRGIIETIIRPVFNNTNYNLSNEKYNQNNNSYSPNNSQPTRTYTPSSNSNSSGSSGSSSGSTGEIVRPNRGGK